jgi:hypothetical protein
MHRHSFVGTLFANLYVLTLVVLAACTAPASSPTRSMFGDVMFMGSGGTWRPKGSVQEVFLKPGESDLGKENMVRAWCQQQVGLKYANETAARIGRNAGWGLASPDLTNPMNHYDYQMQAAQAQEEARCHVTHGLMF